MKLIVCFCCLVSFLLACEQPEPKAGEVVETQTTIAGGDSTARSVSLDFKDLEVPEQHYLVFRQRLPLIEMGGFIEQESEKIVAVARDAGIQTTGKVSGLFYEWDMESGMGDAAVGLPVSAGTELPPYVTISLPAARALTHTMRGGYQGLGAAHFGLDSELLQRGLSTQLPTVEEYAVGPLDNDDPEQFTTLITYRIKPSE